MCQVCLMCVPHLQRCSRRTEEGVESLGARVIGRYELPDMGVGTQTQDTWKNRKCSPPLQSLFVLLSGTDNVRLLR